MLLRNAAQLVVVDHDVLEAKNVLSQFHWRTGVGRKKVSAFAALMQQVFGVKVEPWDIKLTAENAKRIVAPAHMPEAPALILDCVDNAQGRRDIQAVATELGIPWLHAGLAADGAYGMVRWDGAFRFDDAPPGVPTCEDGEELSFITITAAWMAQAAQHFLRTGERRGFAVAPDGATRV
jgi:molybdopterin/thiamine biosynthesis adenylyltransferase